MGFRFAFTVENFIAREVRDDPAYVKYIVRVLTYKLGAWNEKLLSYHKCNQTDWKDFAPATKASQGRFETIRDDPNRGFFCIDWPDDEVLIYGDYSSGDFQMVEISMVPCNYIHNEYGDSGDYIRKECTSNLESQIEYLGNLNLITYATTQDFQFYKYGEDSVKTESTLVSRQVNEKIPNYLDTRV